ncbi:hypothetical protein [Streptomyces sp. NPDC059063]|uniref:hypothetical protein n=1 Tax=Streptomyces sp. NPDC059063 TaxID=3346712 RepID=UPI0036A0A5EE
MSTSGSFTPAALPECPYAPRMTRAAAQALATAGGLLENCVVVITDGPTIGTAGNTSGTEIELNPVSSTAFGQTARVFTSFAPEAWPGVYDLANNSITELRDDWGNTAKDIDATAPTVHMQFPWHLGSSTLRDNYVEDSTLPGWDTQVGSVLNNQVIGSTVDLTGKASGTIQDSLFQSANVVLGAGGASVSFSRSQVYGLSPATVLINHTGAGSISYTDSVQKDGFLVAHTGTVGLTVSDSTLQNHGTAPADISLAGGGTVFIADSTVTGRSDASPAIDSQTGVTGGITIGRSHLNGTRISKVTGSSGPVSVTGSDMTDATVTIGAANAATGNAFINILVQNSTFNLQGPLAGGRNDFTVGAVIMGTVVTVAATATAGIGLQGGVYESASVSGITQNRTAGTGSTTLFASNMRGFSTFTDNGTTDPGVAISFNRLDLTDSTVTVGNVTGKTGSGTVLQQTTMAGSTLTLTGPNGTAFLNRVRLWGAGLTNAGFDGSDLIIDGAFTKTMTATQSNRLCNKSFDDWI